MKDIKLSLVFCCYNVSPYIESIYTWLNKQSYHNIEVIFVEDCSTDNTKEKLFSIINDSRMRIIENKKNLGLSESRNVGLYNATGDYVGFPDPDDMFDLNWLGETVKAIDSHFTKVIISGMREDYENNNLLIYSRNISSKYSGYIKDDFVDAILDLEETLLFGYMNNKFYERNFLLNNNILCKKMALKEDFEFNINVFEKLNDFYILNQPYYFYKKRNNASLTNRFVKDYFDIHMESLFQFKELIETKYVVDDNIKRLLANRFIRYFLSAIERNTNLKSGLGLSEQNNWIKNILNNSQYSYFLACRSFASGKIKVIKFFLNPAFSPLLLGVGHILAFIKSKFPILFVKNK